VKFRTWGSLPAALAVAVGLVLASNSVMGGSGPAASPPPFTPGPPASGSQPSDLYGNVSQVTISGQTIPAPPGAVEQPITLSPSKCALALGVEPTQAITLSVGKSYVVFTPDGKLYDSHVDPQDALALSALLQALTPADQSAFDPPCIMLPDGSGVRLPPGASLSSVIVEAPAGTVLPYPHSYSVVRLGESWLGFTGNTLWLSNVLPQDAQALQPLLNVLKAPSTPYYSGPVSSP
jgi:hypothetical protein